MKIKIYVVSTCIPEPGERPCFPNVFTKLEDAEAHADKMLREEWVNNGPCDEDSGELLPYPGDWREANNTIAAHIEDGSWGEWELTEHEIDLGALAIVMEGGAIQSMLSTGPLAGNSVTVIEYSDKSDEYDVLIPQDGGDPAPAAVGKIEIEESANWLLRALMAINEMEAA